MKRLNALNFAVAFAFSVVFIVPIILRDLGASFEQIGLVFSLSWFAAMLMQPLTGAITDHFGEKRMIRVGALVLAVGTAMMYFFREPWQFAIALAFVGLTHITLYWTAMHLLEADRKKIIKWGVSANWGFLIGVSIAALVAEFIDPYLAFVVCAIPVVYFVFTEIDVKQKLVRKKSIKIEFKLSWLVILAGLGGLLFEAQRSLFKHFLPIFYQQTFPVLGHFTTPALFAVIGQAVWIASRYLMPRLNIRYSGATLVGITTLVFSLATVLYPLVPLPVFLLVYVIANAIASMRGIAIAEMMHEVTTAKHKHLQTQVYSMMAGIAGVGAPYAGGVIADNYGLNYSFFAALPLGILATIVLLVVGRKKR